MAAIHAILIVLAAARSTAVEQNGKFVLEVGMHAEMKPLTPTMVRTVRTEALGAKVGVHAEMKPRTPTVVRTKLTGARGTDAHVPQIDDAAVLSRINDRFGNGQPSKDLKAAGVVVRAFDEKTDSPPFNNMPPWLPLHGDGDDRISASIINSRMPYAFLGNSDWPSASLWGSAGFVISPEAATAILLCAYDDDAASMFMERCDGQHASADCVPGCVGFHGKKHRGWCNISTTDVLENDQCAWPPTAVDAMMNLQEDRVASFLKDCGTNCPGREGRCIYPKCRLYNELILDPAMLSQRLPSAIEAIYFVSGSLAFSPEHAAAGEATAKAMQQVFVEHFKQHVPLMQVSSLKQEPFKLYSA